MRKKGDNSRPSYSLIDKLGSRAAPRIHTDLHVERCTPETLFDIGISTCAPNIRGSGHVVRPGEYSTRPTTHLLCYSAPPLSNDKGTHMASVQRSTHNAFLAISTNRDCSAIHHLQEKVFNSRSLCNQHTNEEQASAPSGLPGRSRAREPKIANRYREKRFLDTCGQESTPPNFTDEHTGVMRSCRFREGLRWCTCSGRRYLVVPQIASQ